MNGCGEGNGFQPRSQGLSPGNEVDRLRALAAITVLWVPGRVVGPNKTLSGMGGGGGGG